MINAIQCLYLPFFMLFLISDIQGQNNEKYGQIIFNGTVYKTMIIGKDTLILADLDSVSISSRRDFTDEELKLFRKYRYYAAKAYPYAKDAINILNTIEERTKDMKSSKRKKYIEMTYRQLEYNFKQQLKSLSKTQGKIMIKMIEKETGESFYNIIKRTRNGFVAFYWHQFSKFYDYNLKQGYIKGQDRVLDTVLQDFYFKEEDNPALNTKVIKNDQKK